MATKPIRLPSILACFGLFSHLETDGALVMAVDANLRICNFQLIQKELPSIADAVDLVYKHTAFEFPRFRPPKMQYAFVGDRPLKGCSELIVPPKKNRPCRYTPAQMRRALQPAKAVEEILRARFGILNQQLPVMGMQAMELISPQVWPIFCSFCLALHNYLLVNNPVEYAGKFIEALQAKSDK